MNGEIFFDMIREQHPISGSSKYLLKRWQKYTIYARNGLYNTGSSCYVDSSFDNPYLTQTEKSSSYVRDYDQRSQLYSTNSIYLYDYVIVSDKFFYDMVYTASVADFIPSWDSDSTGYDPNHPNNPIPWTGEGPNPFLNTPPENYSPVQYPWNHKENTFKNSPNAITNNYILRNRGLPVILRNDGTFFEIVKGYPRNHYTHKRSLFSLFSMKTYGLENRKVITGIYYRNHQTIDSTIGVDGIQDGTSPVQSVLVGNLNLIRTDNAINH